MTQRAPDIRRIHLDYLDGVRGLAALYVTIGHIFQFVWTGVPTAMLATLPSWFGPLSSLFKFGNCAVALFIVLSGYCLMLPVVRKNDHQLIGGIAGFAVRRARRILPAYFATVVFCIGMLLLVPGMNVAKGTQWDISHPAEALSAGSVLSHAALVHNWFPTWRWTLDPPLWSVALEWQIYFVFACILLPVWRKWRSLKTALLGAVLGIIPVVIGQGYLLTWMIFLFALGMAAAVANFLPHSRLKTSGFSQRFPWIPASAVFSLFTLGAGIYLGKHGNVLPTVFHAPLLETCAGLAGALFLVGYTDRLQNGGKIPSLLRVLESKPVVGLGHFSYSLYLIHYPLLAAVYLHLILPLGASPVVNLLLLLGGFVPTCLLAAWGWYKAFELPWMKR